ncbi:toxin, HicA family [Syntrophotalea carbinolica DSM 2380]|uniref:Toxin, HicA family n=1 Tax=Syntrophotalea carbinolica (strain DSM 2380 / NBRC 103641 / GraBd1) TaxID=338963 RepID=Q3A6G2_SYNC1|nr:type II toxin-antitoxin system HicA family toxin [Syntrophotalea carbinolica]ABA88045.1 toxin, HicA family [Syntrophotalea carbinolica DSM 2380]
MTEKRLLKLVETVLSNPKNVRFEELKRLLEGFGFTCCQPRGGSSHYTFRKQGSYPITVPKKRPVNQAYVKSVIKQLNLEEWYDENC